MNFNTIFNNLGKLNYLSKKKIISLNLDEINQGVNFYEYNIVYKKIIK